MQTDGRTDMTKLIAAFRSSVKTPKNLSLIRPFAFNLMYCVGRDSSVGIATGYGLDGPGSNPGKGEIFRTSPDRPLGPPSLSYNGYRVFPGGKNRPGRDADTSPPTSAVVKKE